MTVTTKIATCVMTKLLRLESSLLRPKFLIDSINLDFYVLLQTSVIWTFNHISTVSTESSFFKLFKSMYFQRPLYVKRWRSKLNTIYIFNLHVVKTLIHITGDTLSLPTLRKSSVKCSLTYVFLSATRLISITVRRVCATCQNVSSFTLLHSIPLRKQVW